jgi:hypothetical protein
MKMTALRQSRRKEPMKMRTGHLQRGLLPGKRRTKKKMKVRRSKASV